MGDIAGEACGGESRIIDLLPEKSILQFLPIWAEQVAVRAAIPKCGHNWGNGRGDGDGAVSACLCLTAADEITDGLTVGKGLFMVIRYLQGQKFTEAEARIAENDDIPEIGDGFQLAEHLCYLLGGKGFSGGLCCAGDLPKGCIVLGHHVILHDVFIEQCTKSLHILAGTLALTAVIQTLLEGGGFQSGKAEIIDWLKIFEGGFITVDGTVGHL